jgi:putative Holliday junction resolvase
MRILGLDVGDKTIGIAVSDGLGLTAQPLTTVRRRNLRTDLETIGSLIAEHEISEIVVGIPKSLNNSLGPQAKKVLKFVDVLKKSFHDIIFHTWDERLSTVEAERVLLQADLSRKRRKAVIDKLAASIILQGYLDRKNYEKNIACSGM